jgi:hypothetical protein
MKIPLQYSQSQLGICGGLPLHDQIPNGFPLAGNMASGLGDVPISFC